LHAAKHESRFFTGREAEKNRPEEYGEEVQKEARAIGRMLGSILSAKK
jgi:hypothetical protein